MKRQNFVRVLAFLFAIGLVLQSTTGQEDESCLPNQFQCSAERGQLYRRCIIQHWRCDGESDCPNGDDEVGCSRESVKTIYPATNVFFPSAAKFDVPSVCRSDEFQCASAHPPKCVPIEYQCDHDQDCADGSDETGCFTDESVSNQTVCIPVTSQSNASCDDGIPSAACKFISEEFFFNGTLLDSNSSSTADENNTICTCELGFIRVSIDKTSGEILNASSAASGNAVEVCIDEDECAVLGPDLCSQHCVNTFGSYKCTCSQGFHLTPDGHTCRAYGRNLVLVFSNGTDIFMSNGHTHSVAVTKLSNANDLAMEHSRHLIYWSDSATRRIQRSRIFRPSNPSLAKENIVFDDVAAPNGLTVDWLRRLLFWVDGGRRLIEVIDLNNQHLRRAIVWEDIIRPRDIVCHPLRGLLFWAEWGQDNHRSRIERIAMDGSDAHIVAHKQVYRPCGLVIDFATDRLFWVDATKLTLESTDLQGRHRAYVIPEQSRRGLVGHPTGLFQPIACAVFEDSAYVSDRGERAVLRVRRHPLPRDISDVSLNAFTSHSFSKLGSLLVFHNATQPSFQITPCSALSLNCSELCLPRSSTEYTCACATGHVLQPDNRTCLPPGPTVGYLYLQFKQQLSRISLAGPDYVDRTFFTLPGDDDSHITAFDVDLTTSTFFFARRYSADQMLSLHAAALPQSGKSNTSRHVLTLGTDYSSTGHFEVAVDWITGNIYLLLAADGRIEVVSPLATSNITSYRAVIVWKFISKAAHCLSLHPRGGYMFWLDTAPASKELSASSSSKESFYIVRSGLDGSRLERFLEIGPVSTDISHRPTLMATNHRLFWTSNENRVIMSVKMDGTDKKVHFESSNSQPTLLAASLPSSADGASEKLYFFDSVESTLFSTVLPRNFSTLRIRPVLHGLLSMKTPKTLTTMAPINNPCLKNACSHLCMLSPDVIGYRCACSISFTLRHDGTSCSRNFDSLLLVAHGPGDLLQIDLTTPYSTTLPLLLNPPPENVVAVATDPTSNAVCWADNSRKMVACSGPNLDAGSNSEVIATELDSVKSIAYDYLNKNLYMADTVKPQIAVVHVPSGQLRLLLMRFTITQPLSLALSLHTGHLFWTEWSAAGTTVGARIGRVDMDGANAITIVDGGLGRPQGITVDNTWKRVFWGDEHFSRIESSDFEGEHRQVFLTNVNPYSLVFVGDVLYWTDPESRAIRATKVSNVTSAPRAQPTTTITGVANENEDHAIKTILSDTKNLFGLSTVSRLNVQKGLTSCDISCVGLCLRRPSGHRCLCPTGFQPTPTAASCQPAANQIVLIVGESTASLVFLGDLGSTENSRKQISAKFPAVVLRRPADEQLCDADLEWNTTNNLLYYAVKTKSSSIIYQTHLSAGFKQKRLLSVPNATVLSLAIDSVTENIYWFETSWSTTLTYLRVASITRLYTKTLLTNGFEQPKDLTVHPTRGCLFWINAAGPIETSLADGTERRVLVPRDVGSAASLTLDVVNNLLYWTDTLTASLHVSDLDGKLLRTFSKGITRQAALLAASPTHIFWATGKGKAVYYAPKDDIANSSEAPMRLTEMQQGVRGLGIYNKPILENSISQFSDVCSEGCQFICLRRGESQLVCTCPDNEQNLQECSDNQVLNMSNIGPSLTPPNSQPVPPVPGGEASPVSHSLIALIGVAILFALVIAVVIFIICRQRYRHRSRPRSRSDSVLSVLMCDPCFWHWQTRPDRVRSTSPHANLTSTISGQFVGQDDDASQALMAVTNDKMAGDRGGIEESSSSDAKSSNSSQRNQPRLQRQSQTVVSLRFDATDGGDNITVKRVETVL